MRVGAHEYAREKKRTMPQAIHGMHTVPTYSVPAPYRQFVSLARPNAHLVGDDGHLVPSLVPLLQHRRNLAVPELPVVCSIAKLLPWRPCRWRDTLAGQQCTSCYMQLFQQKGIKNSPTSHSVPVRRDNESPESQNLMRSYPPRCGESEQDPSRQLKCHGTQS